MSTPGNVRLPVKEMLAKHRKLCADICTMYRGPQKGLPTCQRPTVAVVLHHPDPDLCCRTLAEAQILARAKAAYSPN